MFNIILSILCYSISKHVKRWVSYSWFRGTASFQKELFFFHSNEMMDNLEVGALRRY